VGVPKHEARLTHAVISEGHALLGERGKAMPVVLREVELGIGRPDVLLLLVDHERLALRKAAGMRLGNLSEAHILEKSTVSDAVEAIPGRHARRMVRRVEERGWFELPSRRPIVATSLLLEAKVSGWQRGIRQLARVRWAAHRAALVLPGEAAHRVQPDRLLPPAVGLVEVDNAGELRWRHSAPTADIPFYVDAWLGELAIRELDRT
jgi:hypothetical protein